MDEKSKSPQFPPNKYKEESKEEEKKDNYSLRNSSITEDKYVIPPPEDLLAKSVFV